MTDITSVALVDIEPDETINARRMKSDEGLDELKASIVAHGLAQSLRVRAAGKKFKIIAGHRRYRVLCELASTGGTIAGVTVTDAYPVPVIIGDEDDTTAREISQAENLIRLPQHEADTYETFRDLADRGLDEGQIASRFGIESKRVKRMLALGRLSPLVLDWWRTSTARDVADTVRAFTLAPSIEEQERVFKKLKKSGGLWYHYVKREFGAGDHDVGKLLTFVGDKAFTKAGGVIIEDLFGEDHVVSDPALLKKLADEKLAAKVDELIADGWSWASIASEMPQGWSWSWDKLSLNKKKATKAEKAKSGAVVDLDHKGKLLITYGVVKPEDAKKEKKAKDKAEGKAPAAQTVSNAMMHRLSVAATMGTRTALAEEPRVGLVALLAGLTSWNDGPLKASINGYRSGGRQPEKFGILFQRFSAMKDADLFRVAAGLAGEALDLQRHNSGNTIFDAQAAPLANAISADRMSAALTEAFDPADYFGGVAKPLVVQAIREAINDDEAKKADKMKKAELVAFAVANVPSSGWLPPELRCATYGGPGEIPRSVLEPPPIVQDPAGEDELDEDVDQDEAA